MGKENGGVELNEFVGNLKSGVDKLSKAVTDASSALEVHRVALRLVVDQIPEDQLRAAGILEALDQLKLED